MWEGGERRGAFSFLPFPVLFQLPVIPFSFLFFLFLFCVQFFQLSFFLHSNVFSYLYDIFHLYGFLLLFSASFWVLDVISTLQDCNLAYIQLYYIYPSYFFRYFSVSIIRVNLVNFLGFQTRRIQWIS